MGAFRPVTDVLPTRERAEQWFEYYLPTAELVPFRFGIKAIDPHTGEIIGEYSTETKIATASTTR